MECIGSKDYFCDDAAQNNNETENANCKIASADSDTISNESHMSSTVADTTSGPVNACDDDVHLEAGVAIDDVSTEHEFVDRTCSKENEYSPDINMDCDSGVACDAEETAEFDVGDNCGETESRRLENGRTTDDQDCNNVVADAGDADACDADAGDADAGDGDITDECLDSGSHSQKRELDGEMKRNGIAPNVVVVNGTPTTDFLVKNAQLIKNNCHEFESAPCESHLTINSFEVSKSEHNLEEGEPSLRTNKNTSSHHSQHSVMSTTQPELVAMQPTQSRTTQSELVAMQPTQSRTTQSELVAMQPTQSRTTQSDIAAATQQQGRYETLSVEAKQTESRITQADIVPTPLTLTLVSTSSDVRSSSETQSCSNSTMTREAGEMYRHRNGNQMDTVLGNTGTDHIENDPRCAATTDVNDNTDSMTGRSHSDVDYYGCHKENDVTEGIGENKRPDEDIPENENNGSSG